MPKSTLRRERRISLGIQAGLNVLLAAALLSLVRVYFQNLYPAAREWSRGMAVGFPVAICMGSVYFALRAVRLWRRIRKV